MLEERSLAQILAPLGAGLLAGASGTIVGHPMDTAKVRLQVGQPFVSFSFRQLYRGILPPLLTTGIVQSVNFTLYEAGKFRILVRGRHSERMHSKFGYLRGVFAASAVAGAGISLLTTPIGVLKVQQQIVTESGLWSCARRLVGQHGILVLFRGGVPGLVMEMFGRGVYMTTYETIKLVLSDDGVKARILTGNPTETTAKVKMIAAACAGILGWAVAFPIDTIKSRLMQDASKTRFPTVIGCIKETWKEGGIRRLYRGVHFSMIRAAPVAILVLPVYEKSRVVLERRLLELGI